MSDRLRRYKKEICAFVAVVSTSLPLIAAQAKPSHQAAAGPVFHQLPASYEAATSDGQRWRWLLHQTAQLDPGRRNEVEVHFADFLRGADVGIDDTLCLRVAGILFILWRQQAVNQLFSLADGQ